jgi:predicted HD phosphohydrolase
VSQVGVVDHDVLGSEFLQQRGFSSRVVRLVRGHVAAKRYLTATNPSYYERLSEASKCTLALQGGPMSSAEVADFERSELRSELLRLRAWDEQAKVPGASAAPLEDYRPLIHAHLTRSIL